MNLLVQNIWLVQILTCLLVAGGVIGLGLLLNRRDQKVEARVRGLSDSDVRLRKEGVKRQAAETSRVAEKNDAFFVVDGKSTARLKARLFEAGFYQAGSLTLFRAASLTFAIAFPAALLGTGYAFGLPAKLLLPVSVPIIACGFLLPHVWLDRRRARRQLILRRAIPDFLDLIVACMGAGQSIQAALRQVTEELQLAHPELCAELELVLREIDMGGSLDQALNHLAVRTGVDELRTLRSFIQQAIKLGTTITDALQQMAEMFRIQREQRAEELAQKAAVKILLPTMLFIFPTIFVVLAGPAAIQIKEGLEASHAQETRPKTTAVAIRRRMK